MAKNTIKGLTVEIGGDTTKLGKALKEVDEKSRDLQGELRQIDKLLKLDPGNTELIAQKQKVLAEAIETTSKKLKTLKEAEKQVQRQFERGEVSEEQVRALRREIVQTEQKMEAYQREATQTAKATKDIGDEAGKVGDKLKAAGAIAAQSFAAMATAAAAAVAALAKTSTEAAAYADNILTMSTVTGISTEKLQAYSYAAELVDVSVDTLTKSHAKNIKSMKAAQDGTKLAVDAYQKLGVAVTNIDGSLRDGETVYWEVVDALGKMENETERDALAMQILGKSAQELNPLIEAGSERMRELTAEAKEVGAVMSADTLASLGEFDDAMQRLNGSAGAAKNALGTVLLPELVAVTTQGTDLLTEFTTKLNESGGGLDGFVTTIDDMAPTIGEKVGELISNIVAKAGELLPAMAQLAVSVVATLAESVSSQLPSLLDLGVGAIISILDGITSAIPRLAESIATDVIPGLVSSFEAGLPRFIEAAADLIVALADSVDALLPPLIESVPRIVMSIVTALTKPEMLKKLINGGLKLLLALCDAIPLLIEKIVPLIPGIVLAVGDALMQCTPQLLQTGVSLLSALANAVPKACVALLKSLPQIWTTLSGYLKQLPSKVVSVGGDIIKGLWKGISDKASWLKTKIKSWVGDVTKFLKKLFGIHSPSKVTAYMGEMLDEGLAVGIEDNAKTPVKALGALSDEMLDEAGQMNGLTLERRLAHTFNPGTPSEGATTILGKLDQIFNAIERGQILTIDGNALVGATANSMNTALGQRRILAERGAV